MSQKSRILSLLENYDIVTCGHLAHLGLYHSAAKRVMEARREGYEIEFVRKENWNESYYRLKPKFAYEENGQAIFI